MREKFDIAQKETEETGKIIGGRRKRAGQAEMLTFDFGCDKLKIL